MIKTVLLTVMAAIPLMALYHYSQAGSMGTAEEIIALINGWIIDGTGAEPVKDGVLLIRGNRISAVGSKAEVVIPAGARVVDLAGAFVLPGFFNTHVHRGYSERHLKAWAQSGVTTVRDLGAVYREDLFARRDQLGRDNHNARLVAAGPMLTVPHGYPAAVFHRAEGFLLESSDDIHEKVTALLEGGADLLKISLESGGLWRLTLPTFSPEQAAQLVKLAHDRGKRVSAHIMVARDLAHAVAAGVDDIAHMAADPVGDDVIQQMVAQKIFWVPSLELYTCIPARYLPQALHNLDKFRQAGGQVALGTDFAGYRCKFELGMPLKEMRLMGRAGMTPMQIIVAATKNSAYVCGLEKELGTLTVGKLADVIVVKGNPLKDLGQLANVGLVIKNGEILPQRSLMRKILRWLHFPAK
jgi:imidazolonepropionase-like amidohydrolase